MAFNRYTRAWPPIRPQGQSCSGRIILPYCPIRLDQQGKKIRPLQLRPRLPVGGQALAYLRNSFFSLPLLGQRPAPQDSCLRENLRESLLCREGNSCLCPLLGESPLPAELMKSGSKL